VPPSKPTGIKPPKPTKIATLMLIINLYFVIAYIVSFEIANKKANNGDGWDIELVTTFILFPLVMPILILMEIHAFLEKKSLF
jgi:predicted transporter